MIRIRPLPTAFAKELYKTPAVENFLFSSWEGVAVSTQEMAWQLRQAYDASPDHADRTYLAREMMALGVETVEAIMSAYLKFSKGDTRGPHQASNDELHDLSQQGRFEPDRLLNFLGVPLPEGTPILHGIAPKIEARTVVVLSELARYWRERIESVRWFRHLPLSLSPTDVHEFASPEDQSFRDVLAIIDKQGEQLDAVVVLPYGNELHYIPLYLGEIKTGSAVARYAIALLFMLSGNQLLDTNSAVPENRLPKVSRLLLDTLSPEEMRELIAWGGYFFVD